MKTIASSPGIGIFFNFLAYFFDKNFVVIKMTKQGSDTKTKIFMKSRKILKSMRTRSYI